MTITTGSFPSGLKKDYVTQVVMTNYMDMEKINEKVFQRVNSSLQQDLFQGTAALGYAPVVTEGSDVTFDQQQQTYPNYITKVSYGLGVSITWEAQNYIQAPVKEVLNKTATYLSQSILRTTETAAANIINNAFTTTYGDGVPLVSASHPVQGDTQSNRLAIDSDLTYTSAVDMITQIKRAKDYRGNIQDVEATGLLIPVELWSQAAEVFDSKLNPENANNAVNAIVANGFRLDVINWKYLTSPTAWFMLTSAKDGGLIKTVHAPMEVKVKNTEQMNGFGENFIAQSNFGVGFGGEFRTIYGTPGI